MSILSCIAKLQGDGTITREQADNYKEAFEKLRKAYRDELGAAAGDAAASRELVARVEGAMMQDRRQKLLQLGAQKSILQRLDQALRNNEVVARVAKAFFTRMEGVKNVPDVDLRHVAIRAMAWSKMDDLMGAMHRKIGGGLGNPALMDNIVRELFGHGTGDAEAVRFAKAWTETAEWLRAEYNAAGGAIPKLEGWALPQAHDNLLVRRASFEDWRDFTKPLLGDMRDARTGRPLLPDELDEALRAVYDTIRTEGWDKAEAGEFHGAGSLAARRLDHRFLHFKDADSWMAYQKRFGGNAWDAMTGHIDGMSRDIASMQIFGPNPAYTVRWLRDVLMQDAQVRGSEGDIRQAAKAGHDIANMWGVHSGEAMRSINPQFSRAWATVRQANAGSKLGGASITGLADLGFTHAMANYNGLNATRLVASFVKNLNPLSDADRALARKTGLLSSEYTSRARDLWQNHDTISKAHEISSRTAEGVMRLSGLHVLTSAGQAAIAREFMISVGENAGKAFHALDPKLQRVLSRYDIDAAHWDAIRGAGAFSIDHDDFGKVSMIRPDEVAARRDIDPALAQRAATRFYEMIEGEKRFGMPDAGASLGVRAMLNWGAGRRGTWIGEILHSASQFKQFPVSVINRSLTRAIYGDGTALNRATFAANAIISTTVMGALIMQMKSIAGGKDPEPMESPAFWARAAMQGGALGIYGDFLKDYLVLPGDSQKLARDSKSISDLIMGPTLQSVVDPVLRIGLHDTSLAASGELDGGMAPSNVGREIAQFVRENTPGSNLWYARAAFNRILWDKLQTMIDPNAEGSFDRLTAKAEEQDHTRFWWAPGQSAPDHAPDLSNAVQSP